MKEDVMVHRPMRKLFYDLSDAGRRLDLSLVDIGAFVVERKMRVCTPAAGLLVEFGLWENEGSVDQYAVAEEVREVSGLVDLRPQDALAIIQSGSAAIEFLDAASGSYRRIIRTEGDPPGFAVRRENLGVRHEVLQKLADEFGVDLAEPTALPRLGALRTHDWDACMLEVSRLFYFEGVPESKAALIRHVQAWFASQGPKVPDESTLQKKLKDTWAMFAPEARKRRA
ncbi:hypothetical protein DFH01_23900 [Falsiroseomonas bella]|uniref:Uncharacterized protein n=1 Tax=Falsiroseomonas bella TaxID=2184016 RepID=A0A317FAH1_9PROT|nr:hypothetical protein [Falsiroseomonas bella]PWS34586.1 hypothetical protein DFH01_23900 [Falsiroseomonas bella]